MSVDPVPSVAPHSIAVVVPVYRGEQTLRALCAEIASLSTPFVTAGGHPAQVAAGRQ